MDKNILISIIIGAFFITVIFSSGCSSEDLEGYIDKGKDTLDEFTSKDDDSDNGGDEEGGNSSDDPLDYDTCGDYCFYGLGQERKTYMGICTSNISRTFGCTKRSDGSYGLCDYFVKLFEDKGIFDCKSNEYCVCWTSDECGSTEQECERRCTADGCTG